MYTHNLCILHAPLSNASHKANCHSPPKISKSRINLGNKSLSEIWSASWCGPERSAAWESWQPGCAKKGNPVVGFFFSFIFSTYTGVLQRLRPWIPFKEIRKNATKRKWFEGSDCWKHLHYPGLWMAKNRWFPADQEMIWALASTWMWTAADLTAFVLSLGLPKGELICSWESPEGNLLEVLLFVFGLREISIKSKVIIYLNDVPWMHPWNQRLCCWASELPSLCPWEHC